MSVTNTIKLQHMSTGNLYNTFQARTKGTHFSEATKSFRPWNNPFTLTVYLQRKRSMTSATNRNAAIRSSLIDPDGGSLVELVVPDTQRALKTSEAESLPKLSLTHIDLEWVHVISQGWASPLKGFMRENEYLQTLHFNSLRLGDGSLVNMSLPIVLAIDDHAKLGIGSSPHVALVGPDGDFIALLKRLLLFFLFFLFWFVDRH